MKKSLFYFAIIGLSTVILGQSQATLAQQLLPAAPAKVLRYVDVVMERYDLNGDGILQREEWMRMPGIPRSMDINGDGLITREELTWHLVIYGNNRTIHRTVAVDLREQYRFDPENMRVFRPIVQRVTEQPASSGEAASPVVENGVDLIISANEEIVDDDVYMRLLNDRLLPAARPYHALPAQLQGVPTWFILLDRNGDGQISMQEFDPTFNPRSIARFRMLDTNNNGFIEPDEARASVSR